MSVPFGPKFGTNFTSLVENGVILINETPLDAIGDAVERYAQSIVDTREKLVRDGLIKLGWTPPGEKAKVRLVEDELIQALALVRGYDNLLAAEDAAKECAALPGYLVGGHRVRFASSEIIASIDSQKKEAQDALGKLGIEYP